MNDLISRSALMEQMHNHYEVRNPKQNATMDECCMMVIHAPAVDAVEVIHCKDCTLWDREHIEMHPRSTEHPEQQAEFAECQKWSTWSTCFMTRTNDYCSQAKRRNDDG